MDINIISLHKIAVTLISAIGLWLGFLVWFTNRKLKANQMFLLLTIFIALWLIFYYLNQSSNDPEKALLWARLAAGAVSLFFIPFYFFFIYFLNLEKRFQVLNKSIFLFGITFFVLSVFTDLFMRGVEFKKWGVDVQFGPLSSFFFGFAIILSTIVVYLILKKYFPSIPQEKLRLKYFFAGVLIWIGMNFVFNMILSLWKQSIQYSYFGHYSAIFLLVFTAYAILKRKLFDIKIILTELLVGVFVILLFVQIFLSNSMFEYIWHIIIFIIFLFFGYFLIRSVLKEIEIKEKIGEF